MLAALRYRQSAHSEDRGPEENMNGSSSVNKSPPSCWLATHKLQFVNHSWGREPVPTISGKDTHWSAVPVGMSSFPTSYFQEGPIAFTMRFITTAELTRPMIIIVFYGGWGKLKRLPLLRRTFPALSTVSLLCYTSNARPFHNKVIRRLSFLSCYRLIFHL